MLYRKKIVELRNWKANESVALLVEGARQVGKTSLIEEFLKEFESSIEIDFTKNTNALSLLLEVKNYEDFIDRLSIISSTKLKGNNSVLFLDEIQYYYEIREKRILEDASFAEKYIDILTLSKEIVRRGDFRLILSGSLLGVSIFSVNLNPTGYLRKITMHPMDFEEFLLANNINQNVIDDVKKGFIDKKPISSSIHELFLDLFNKYIFIGGLPAAVQGYVDDKSIELTSNALDSIDDWYKGDIIKYANKEDRLIILEMYNLLASEITMKNRKFVKSHLDVPNFKNLNLKDRFLWLKNAGIAIPTYNVTNPVYPIKISEDSKIVKLFFSDVGLLTHHIFGKEEKRKLLIDSTGVDLGAPYENAAAELLTSHGYETRFHSLKKNGEIDFVIERNMSVLPIEIKSIAPKKVDGVFSHPALDNLLNTHKEIKEAWVFGKCNVKQENDRVWMFPIYMIDFLQK